ncbi:MAG: Zn-dependent hydrolase, partial [Rhodothermales bacterium]|nr:Zn-dependent hydrolase [Rhodothermales bacterium]
MIDDPSTALVEGASAEAQDLLDTYTSFRLAADLSALSEQEKQMIPLLIDAAQAMDAVFWVQAYGNRDSLLDAIDDPGLRRYAEINYGPWDRLDANRPFIAGVGAKPAGANFYPADMTKETFEAAAEQNPALRDLYTMVRYDEDGNLVAVPYHEFFYDAMHEAAGTLREAAALAEDPGLRRYLELRADALTTGDYQPSDLAWMDMKDN